MMKNINIPVYLFIFPIIPFLFIITNNYIEIKLFSSFFMLLIISIATVFTFFIMNIKIKNVNKSALISAMLIILLFNINSLFSIFQDSFNFKLINKYLFLLSSFLIWFGFSFLIIKKDFKFEKLNKILNIIAISLLVINICAIPLDAYNKELKSLITDIGNTEKTASKNKTTNTPDIYYIILDAYSNNRALKEFYNYDNKDFIEWLEKEGFYVAKNSTANYPITLLSVTSTLKMNYVYKDIANLKTEKEKNFMLSILRENNTVLKSLLTKGYKFYFIGNRSPFKELEQLSEVKLSKYSNNLIVYIINSSIFGLLNIKIVDFQVNDFNKDIEWLNNSYKIKGHPKFIMVHLLAPHPPYLFDKTGKPNKFENRYKETEGWSMLKRDLYLGSLINTNRIIKELIINLKKNSSNKPIIIIQSDHGPCSCFLEYCANQYKKYLKQKNIDCSKYDQAELMRKLLIDNSYISSSSTSKFTPYKNGFKERFGIINAYYFPDGKYNNLYNDITPINSFRIILNQYFKEDFSLLEDKNYYSEYNYVFFDVTDDVRKIYRNEKNEK